MEELIIFAVVNLFAASLSGAAGGGGGLISIPLLIVLGLPPSTAIATGKFGGLGISSGASLRFFREKITDKRTVIIFSLMSVVGAVVGSFFLLRLSHREELLEVITGLMILFVGIPLLYVRNMGIATKITAARVRSLGYVLLFLGVTIQAALGAGIGSLQLVVLMSCFGMTAIVASATRRVMQLVVAIVSLGIFIAGGIVDYHFGIVALVSSLVGGYFGAHIAIKKGNKFVINLFAITSIILALQLLTG